MRRLQHLWAFLVLLLCFTEYNNAQHIQDHADSTCAQRFRNTTSPTSPWLWKEHVDNFDYKLFYSELPDSLKDPSLPWDQQNITLVLSRAAEQGISIRDISYPLAVRYEDIVERCGQTSGTYSWTLISDTLTTWILPIIGLIVSLPWESNKRGLTVLMVFRWIGGAFASLTYCFWSLRVMGRCSMMVDMGSGEFGKNPTRENTASNIATTLASTGRRMSEMVGEAGRRVSSSREERGSLATLWTRRGSRTATITEEDGEKLPPHLEADVDDPDLEAFIRMPDAEASFSANRDSFAILAVMNQYKIYDNLPLDERTLRRNILIACFGSDTLNGKFGLTTTRASVATSIRRLRKRGVVPVMATLGWFFFALALSLYQAFGDVGDNATAHNLALGLLMGWLPVLVSAAIVDRNSIDSEYVCGLLNQLMFRVHPHNTTFTTFVGQARSRWHYGVAHPILNMLERNPKDLIKRPVDWQSIAQSLIHKDLSPRRPSEGTANSHEEEAPEEDQYSLTYFSYWEVIYMAAAWCVVGLSVVGAYYISFNTPTVGLGCRSFSYVMFLSFCSFSGLLELSLYPVVYRPIPQQPAGPAPPAKRRWSAVKTFFRSQKFRSIVNIILYALEIASTLILFTTVFMQTTGLFQFYWCRSSLLGGRGGYVIFDGVQYVVKYFDARMYWMIGTILSCVAATVGIWWCLREWLTQSFLWSQDEEKARRGLDRVRGYRWCWWVIMGGRRGWFGWLRLGRTGITWVPA